MVYKNPNFIKYVPKQFLTKELCLFAFSNNPKNFKYIPKIFLSSEICEKAFEYDNDYIKYIPSVFHNKQMKLYKDNLYKQKLLAEQFMFSNERNDDD